VMKRVQVISIFIVLMLVLAVPVSAAFQFSSFKFNRPDFPLRISKEKISNEEALEIAKSNGVENDPCCPGVTVKPASVKINGVWTTVLSVYGPCGKILYLDPYSGEVLGSDAILCMCVCFEKQGPIFTGI